MQMYKCTVMKSVLLLLCSILVVVIFRMLINTCSIFQAYITLCDLLVLFSNQLGQGTHAALEQLVYEADRELQQMLNGFIQTYVFIDEDEGKEFSFKNTMNPASFALYLCIHPNFFPILEELDEHSKIEELHKRRNFLASFCKLIVYNMMPVQVAGDVFKHYVKVNVWC